MTAEVKKLAQQSAENKIDNSCVNNNQQPSGKRASFSGSQITNTIPDSTKQHENGTSCRPLPSEHFEESEEVVPWSSIPKKLQHPLSATWCLWYTKKDTGHPANRQNYEDMIKLVGTASTVEEFWAMYIHCLAPSELPQLTDYHLFKQDIKPMWEDPINKPGGKWIVRIPKQYTNKLWEDLILAMTGNQLGYADDICGAVISIRYQEDGLALWSKNIVDRQPLCDSFRNALNLPENVKIEYREHDRSLKNRTKNYTPYPNGNPGNENEKTTTGNYPPAWRQTANSFSEPNFPKTGTEESAVNAGKDQAANAAKQRKFSESSLRPPENDPNRSISPSSGGSDRGGGAQRNSWGMKKKKETGATKENVRAADKEPSRTEKAACPKRNFRWQERTKN